MFSRNAIIIATVMTLACLCRSEDQHLWAAPEYGKVDPREYMPQSIYTSCVFWACMNQNPTTFGTWGVPDGSSSRNNGTQTNANSRPVFTNYQAGALLFDGVDDFISCGTGTPPASSFCLSAWVQTATNSTGMIFTQGDIDNVSDGALQLYVRSTSPYLVFYTREGGTPSILNVTNSIHDLGEHHIVAKRDATDMSVYIDGIMVSNATLTARNTATVEPRLLGKRKAASAFPFNGRISDFAEYYAALSDAQIKALYAAQKPRHP